MRRTRRFPSVAVVALALVAVTGVLAAGAARAGTIVVLPRPGQVGVSLDGQYGTLLNNGNLGDQFDAGAGMAVRLRYRMRYERGIGLSFEAHGFEPRPADSLRDLYTGVNYAPGDPNAYKRLNLFLYGVDFYQMFDTRTKTVKMLSVGAGIAHPVFTLNEGDQQYPLGDGGYVSAGAGIERFFWQSLAYDIGVRYQAVFIDGKVNHDLQGHVGLIFYASL
jgi:hypothetical protein